jgi:2-oxoglutarate ferredoxin oxidoreductase subunit gamma
MDTEAGKRTDLIIAGLGGQGILMGGKILAGAAMSQYRNSLWLPSYGSRVRGGPSECTVIFSDDEIDSPVLLQADVVILVDPPQFMQFDARVKTGGFYIVESAGLNESSKRDDIRMFAVPALSMAIEMGEKRASNMILLGVYVGLTEALQVAVVEEEIGRRFGKREKVLSSNLTAFRMGLEKAPALVV